MRIESPHLETEEHGTSSSYDPYWLIAERVTQSEVFSRAAQLRAMLLFLVRHSLEQPNEPIREYDIGHSVLGRRADFNPIEDNIVRVQMGHLRKKLERYFAGEGASENTVILIPVGSYTPVFETRRKMLLGAIASQAEPESTDVPHSVSVSRSETTDQSDLLEDKQSDRDIYKFLLYLLGSLALLALGYALATYKRHILPHTGTAKSTNPIMQELFATGRPTYTVLADTSLVTLQTVAHSDITISDYIDPSYPDNVLAKISDPALRTILRPVALHHYTSLDDADVAARSTEWASRLGGHAVVRFARLMHVRDFEAGNFIIVGSRRGNPWTSLFEPRLNFAFREDPSTHSFYFENRNPKPGEEPEYRLVPDSGGGIVTYVDVAVVPNLARTGTVLILNGFSMESNEAAMNIIFSNHLPDAIATAASRVQDGMLEVLIRVHNVDAADAGYEIVSVRSSPLQHP